MKIPFYYHRKQKISGIKSRKEKGQMFLHIVIEKFLLSQSLELKNAVIFGLALKSLSCKILLKEVITAD